MAAKVIEHVLDIRSHCHFHCNFGVWFIANYFKVFKLEIIDILHRSFDEKFRIGFRFPFQLLEIEESTVFNPLPNDKILVLSKVKTSAHDLINTI